MSHDHQHHRVDPRDDEFAELIVYVSDMRRSFAHQLAEQLQIIRAQEQHMQQQSQTIVEQREYIDELAWQIRDLRDSIRRVKETVDARGDGVAQQQQRSPVAPKPAPRRQLSGDSTGGQPAMRSRITIEEILDTDEENCNNKNTQHPNNYNADDLYETIENIQASKQSRLQQLHQLNGIAAQEDDDVIVPLPGAPRGSLTEAEAHERRNRFALARNRRTYRHSLTPIPDERAECGGPAAAPLNEAIARLQLDLRRHDRDSLDAEDALESVFYRCKEQLSFRRNSQRGSSKAVCSMFSNLDEPYLPPDEYRPESASRFDELQLRRIGRISGVLPAFGGGDGGSRNAISVPVVAAQTTDIMGDNGRRTTITAAEAARDA